MIIVISSDIETMNSLEFDTEAGLPTFSVVRQPGFSD